ncbi:MAG TPA: hypothetical protein VG714_05905 [Acidobacteriaceae bacterium]|nr:hypothetical protein [Acidobacteriaceae bacterium]
MMSSIPVLIVVWAVFTGVFLALLAYNGTITRYEENQLFLEDINANEKAMQTSILQKVARMRPYIRASAALSGLLTIAIVGIYTWDAWQRIHM